MILSRFIPGSRNKVLVDPYLETCFGKSLKFKLVVQESSAQLAMGAAFGVVPPQQQVLNNFPFHNCLYYGAFSMYYIRCCMVA